MPIMTASLSRLGLFPKKLRDHALAGSHYPHTVIVAIGNVDIPLRVHITPMRPVQSSRDGWTVVAGTTPTSSSNCRDDSSRRVNMTNGVVLGVHDQQVTVVITPDGLGGSPGSCKCWTTVATVATLASPGVG